MASVYNSVTSGSLSSSIKGFGGLASGLDRDSLIEGMTAATRAKIAKQQKSKQTLQWKQDAYRSISTKLIELSRKYTSYTSPETNLSSASFWTRSSVAPTGINSKYVQVTGSPTSSGNVSIVGVEQLAEKASLTSNGGVSSGVLTTGEISLAIETVSALAGESLKFQIGNKTFNVKLGSGEGYDYSTAEKAVNSIRKSLEGISVGDIKLSQMIDVVAEPSGEPDNSLGTPFNLNFKYIDEGNNEIRLAGGSEAALKALGFESGEKFAEFAEAGKTVIKESGLDMPESEWNIIKSKQNFFKDLPFQDRVDGKKMTFTYNGVSKSIDLTYKNGQNVADMAKDLEEKLAKEFGAERIRVRASADNKLEFYTVKPGGDPGDPEDFAGFESYLKDYKDTSSDLAISSADSGVMEALKVKAGQSNRLDLDAPAGQTQVIINGKEIEGITDKSSINDIIKAINESDIGVTVTYMKNADRFSIVSKEEGASGKIVIEGDTAKLFGFVNENGDPIRASKEGKDAIVSVRYGDSTDPVKLTRGSNTFNVEGMNVTVSGTFNVDGSDASQEVFLNAKVDSDKIVKAVSDMIKDYNAMIKLVNDELSTKPNRKYEPLTDEQKEQMKESQIEKWEEEAKKGMLFGDSELRSLSDSLRFVFGYGGDEIALLDSFGITKSTDYSDNGTLSLDESKFRAALENSGQELQDLFTRKADEATGDRGGIMTRMAAVSKQYASTTGSVKGSLIEKAGSTYAPTSILSNTLKKSMDEVDKFIERLQAQLKVETDRYVKQFTSLETVISQMNSQSSWLQGTFGG